MGAQPTLCFLLIVLYFSLVLQYIKILYGTFNWKHRVLLYWEQQQKSLKGLKGEKKVKQGSLEKILKNNMNQLDTYTDANFESRIEKFINEDKVALITSDALFKKYNKYKCKVNGNL